MMLHAIILPSLRRCALTKNFLQLAIHSYLKNPYQMQEVLKTLMVSSISTIQLWLLHYWGEPERDQHWLCMPTENVRGDYVDMYLLFTCVCPWWFPRSVYTMKCSVNSSILACSHVWFRENYGQRQVGECANTWYKRIQPTETVSGPVAARQQWPVGFWTVLLVCGIHIILTCATLNLLSACVLVVNVDVEPYRLTVRRDITGTAGYVAIVTM